MTDSRLTLTPAERVDGAERDAPGAGLDDSLVPRPAAPDPDDIRLQRMIRFWRVAAVVSTALGLVAVFLLYTAPAPPPPPAPERASIVAMLAPEGGQGAGWVATLDANYRQILLVPFGDTAARVDRAHELWFSAGAGAPPRSLGVIDKAVRIAAPEEALRTGGTLTISVEPPGGSPTGQPTGPLAFSGVLTPTE